MLRGRIPGQVIIQYTDSCNALCPQCSMRKTEGFFRSKLSELEVRKIIDSAARQNIQAISFTGGEPFLYEEELLQHIQYATKKKIPFIRTGTNGFMFRDSDSSDFEERIHNFAEALSKTKLRNFWISIDSAEAETHEKMRGLDGVIKGIEKALPIFHLYDIYPSANLGINRNMGGFGRISMKMTDPEVFYEEAREAFERFYQFIMNLGFTIVNACYPMSMSGVEETKIKAVYGAVSSSGIVSFTNAEKIQLFKALMDTIPKFRSGIRIFTPLASLYALIKQYEGDAHFSMPCRGGIDFFFVDAKDGNTYPCGYRGNENFGKFYDINIGELNAKPFCKACDWECFRDPSEIIEFLIQSLRNPTLYLNSNFKDSNYKKLWREDLRYYKDCDFFDGRKSIRNRIDTKPVVLYK